jgi:hypothetical protein
MKQPLKATLGRREFFGALGGGVVLVAATGSLTSETRALPANYQEKRKSRYQADSQEVRDFYRVNRYPTK